MHRILLSILLVSPMADSTFAQSDAHALSEIAGDEFLAENVRHVRHRAAQLAPAERFDYLTAWVFPNDRHPGIRLSGAFTQTDPPPVEIQSADGPERPRGGGLVSPVFDLLDVAAETGRLKELRQKLADLAEPQEQSQLRAEAALLLLVNLELGDRRAAADAAQTLRALVLKASPDSVADMWPETLAVYRGLLRFGAVREIGDLLTFMYSQRTRSGAPRGATHWHSHVAALVERYHHLSAGDSPAALDAAADIDDWVPASRGGAEARGYGSPHVRWHRTADNEIHHLAGLDEDYLFFRTPLRGNFEVEGDMGAPATTQFYAAGRYFGPRVNGGLLETGTFRSGSPLESIDPPLSGFDPWVRFRIVFRDGVRTAYLNGRRVHSEALPELHDPWIGVRSWSTLPARIRNVRISGEPDIPEAVLLSGTPDLAGWRPYCEESAGFDGAIWQHLADPNSAGQIHGRRRGDLDGTLCESLLFYQRPLDEHGSVEYDFFYEPGVSEVHPALDRMAFLLDPRGVRIHWITDGKFGTGDVTPDNVIDEPYNRRGPQELTLAPGAWNHMKLSVAAGTATLELNGGPIFERELNFAAPRTFGLFRYAGRTEARVRNVVMTGDWPRRLPPPPEQKLADHVVESLDADLPRLSSVFTHNFAEEDLTEQYFIPIDSDQRSSIAPGPDGVQVIRPGSGAYSSLALHLRFAAIGDFDFEAAFEAFEPPGDMQGAVRLLARLGDEQQHRVRLSRTLDRNQLQQLNSAVSVLQQDGSVTYPGQSAFCEAAAGRLRLVRRGSTVHYLFAENDSPVFRLLRSEEVSDGPVLQDRIALITDCNGAGETRVVWKSVTLRAEQLMFLAPTPERTLYVMNADGSELRELITPPDGFTRLGSPGWCADGRRIALGVSTGSLETARMLLVNVDNGQAQDLGLGCMPSFSRDANRFVYTQPERGIVMMNVDGAGRRVIDPEGFGAEWSPDGRTIAYGKAGNIMLRDVATGEERQLLRGEHATRYEYVYWNFGWSHDSRSIAFKGRNPQTGDFELAVADVDSPDRFQVLFSTTDGLNDEFTWAPDNRRVLFAMHSPDHDGPRLYVCRRDEPGPPMLFPDQPANFRIFSAAWSSDDRITFVGQRIPQSVIWPPEGERERQTE